MLTKPEMRTVASLQDKRNRDRLGVYVVEGDKLVREAVALGAGVESIYAERSWMAAAAPVVAGTRVVEVSEKELLRLSVQKTPNGALAVIRRPQPLLDWDAIGSDLVLVLDGVQDPGNVGSLLRVAAWFGIADVVASPDSADAFSPKVVQSSMGALFHVRVHAAALAPFVAEARDRGLPIYAAALQGESVYEADLGKRGLILLGNESSGLSEEMLGLASMRVTIPAWSESGPGKDSLNVAAAAAVVCSEFRRRGAPPAVGGHSGDRA
jgi:TrmH family RNA methyltransferase